MSLRLPDFKIYCPSSQVILGGVQTVEARPYVLGYRHIAQPDAETCLAIADNACAKDLQQTSLPCQEYVSQQELSGVDVCKLEMGMLPLQCDAESLWGQVAEVTDREQNTLADEPGVKRRRILAKLPLAEGAPRTRDHHRGGPRAPCACQ